jgi:hypothetical protein
MYALTVTSRDIINNSVSGMYVVLYDSNRNLLATGFTPARFTMMHGQVYQVEVQGNGSYFFQYWSGTGSVNQERSLEASNSISLTAVLCHGPPGTCPDPTPVGGINVFVHRVQASYWAACFALACGAGTGPGTSMFVELVDSSGNVIGSGFANEQGISFGGLTPGITYYLHPDDCYLCHGSLHDVVFSNWGNGETMRPLPVLMGESLDAFYTCSSNCT